jgi:hypothetical protein
MLIQQSSADSSSQLTQLLYQQAHFVERFYALRLPI